MVNREKILSTLRSLREDVPPEALLVTDNADSIKKRAYFRKARVDSKKKRCIINLPYDWIRYFKVKDNDTFYLTINDKERSITLWHANPRKIKIPNSITEYEVITREDSYKLLKDNSKRKLPKAKEK